MKEPIPPIRRATPGDAEAIAALHIASWKVVYRGALPDEFLDSQDLSARTTVWRNTLLDSDDTVVLVWEEGDELISFCASRPTRDRDQDAGQVWELYNLHVMSERRGGGMGTVLFNAAERLGREHGRSEMSLWVAADNMLAQRFYEKHGMRADGAREPHPAFKGVELPIIRYRKRL